MPYTDKLYLTKVDKDFDADCFFPEVDYQDWKLISFEENISDGINDFTYSYHIYKRINNSN